MSRIFISHVHTNEGGARALAAALSAVRYEPWCYEEYSGVGRNSLPQLLQGVA
jgi:hypothetical protein